MAALEGIVTGQGDTYVSDSGNKKLNQERGRC